jgi:hypothetical protein
LAGEQTVISISEISLATAFTHPHQQEDYACSKGQDHFKPRVSSPDSSQGFLRGRRFYEDIGG